MAEGLKEEGGRKGRAIRRLVHMAAGLAVIYFYIPVELPWFGLRRWVLLIAFFAILAVFEWVRLSRRAYFPGLRPHERGQIASFLWTAAGITLVLWCFPHDVASVAIIGMALVDPLIGELRRMGGPTTAKVGLPVTAYLCIALVVFWLSGHWTIPQVLLLSIIGAIVAIPSEWYKIAYVDDDFLMMTVPAIVMAWLTLAF